MNKYIVSNNGLGIAVGVTGSTAKEDAILAENIYGCNTSDHLFNSLIYMADHKQFRRFLILKEYFKVWDEHWLRNENLDSPRNPNIYQFTKESIRRAKKIIQHNTRYENFMQNISSRNNEYSMGFMSAEKLDD